MHLPTAQKSRSERNCSGFFLCRGIIKRCTPLGSKCTPHRPFVKWYRGVKRNRLRGDHFRTTVEPVIVKRYRKTLVNRGFYKKKLDTRFDTHCIKTGVQLWSEWRDSNSRPRGPKPRVLSTELHPDIRFFCMIPCGERKSKFFVSVGGAVVKPKIAGVFQAGNFRRRLLSQRLPGSRFQGNGWGVYPPKASALPTALHPDILLECSTLLLSQLFYYNI